MHVYPRKLQLGRVRIPCLYGRARKGLLLKLVYDKLCAVVGQHDGQVARPESKARGRRKVTRTCFVWMGGEHVVECGSKQVLFIEIWMSR